MATTVTTGMVGLYLNPQYTEIGEYKYSDINYIQPFDSTCTTFGLPSTGSTLVQTSNGQIYSYYRGTITDETHHIKFLVNQQGD